MSTRSTTLHRVRASVPLESCPITQSLGCYGRKWALLVLRDVAFLANPSFGDFLRRNEGLTPRALSIQLRNLIREGAIVRVVDPIDRRRVLYKLTPRGRDAVPILAALLAYGMRHHADRVFPDGNPRSMEQVYPGEQPLFLGRLIRYARKAEAALLPSTGHR
jgi:DNA-binding HxlR family transcriptional regulator